MFNVQDLAGVDLYLYFPVSLVLTEPAVAGEHILLPVHWHRDLHTVQEPTGTQALVGVANQETVDLNIWEADRIEESGRDVLQQTMKQILRLHKNTTRKYESRSLCICHSSLITCIMHIFFAFIANILVQCQRFRL